MLGLTREEADEAAIAEVWPDNLTVVNVFVAMSTQWQVGPGGAIGMIYSSLEPVLRLNGVPRKEWAELFNDFRVMEAAALEQIRENG